MFFKEKQKITINEVLKPNTADVTKLHPSVDIFIQIIWVLGDVYGDFIHIKIQTWHFPLKKTWLVEFHACHEFFAQLHDAICWVFNTYIGLLVYNRRKCVHCSSWWENAWIKHFDCQPYVFGRWFILVIVRLAQIAWSNLSMWELRQWRMSARYFDSSHFSKTFIIEWNHHVSIAINNVTCLQQKKT